MATLARRPFQHVGTLVDMNTAQSNVPRVKRTNNIKFATVAHISPRGNADVKHICIQENQLQKLLDSPTRAEILNINDIIILPDSTFSTLQSPNMGKRRQSSRALDATATPSTPPVAIFQGDQLVAVNETAASILGNSAVKSPHLDKALPPKPALRSQDSPERRGLLDAMDSRSVATTHPVLQPVSIAGDSPESFKVASSLCTTPDSASTDVEHGTGVTLEGELVSVLRDKDFRNANIKMAVPIRNIGERSSATTKSATVSRPSDRRAGSAKNGSPIQRKSVAAKGSSSSHLVPLPAKFDTGDQQNLNSYPSNGDLARHAKYGVGPTVRYSADAHAVIMGTSPAYTLPLRSSSLPKPQNATAAKAKVVNSATQSSFASRLARPTRASAARAAASNSSILQRGKIALSKKTSLSTVSAGRLTISNLSKEAGSSIAANPLPKSDTMTSFKKASKGLKSRFSAMMPGRRRTHTLPKSKFTNFCVSAVDEAIAGSDHESMHCNPKRASILLTTYNNSGMEMSPSNDVHTYETGQVTGEMSDKMSTDRDQQERQQDLNVYDHGSEAQDDLNTTSVPAGQPLRFNRGDDEPPTPPPTREGAAGHYAEEEMPEANGNLPSDDEFDLYVEQRLSSAERYFHEVVRTASNEMDDATAAAVRRIIETLANTIISARNARIAGIELRAATANLIDQTAFIAREARRAVVDAIHSEEN